MSDEQKLYELNPQQYVPDYLRVDENIDSIDVHWSVEWDRFLGFKYSDFAFTNGKQYEHPVSVWKREYLYKALLDDINDENPADYGGPEREDNFDDSKRATVEVGAAETGKGRSKRKGNRCRL